MQTLKDLADTKLELDIQAGFLEERKKCLDALIQDLIEKCQKAKDKNMELQNEIEVNERDKDNLWSDLQWETQSREQRECELLRLNMEVEIYRQELKNLQSSKEDREKAIEEKMNELKELQEEKAKKLSHYRLQISGRGEELNQEMQKATTLELLLMQKKQELVVLEKTLDEVENDAAKKRNLEMMEMQLQEKYTSFTELQKHIIERETRDSIFKLRSAFIDGSDI